MSRVVTPLMASLGGWLCRPRGALLAFLALTAPAHAEPYLVGNGDVLSINVYGDTALSGSFPVGPDGAVSYPLLGSLAVGGKSTVVIQTELSGQLAVYLPKPSISVSVAAYRPVYVLGDVENPGDFDFRPGLTALQLLALAGGPRRVVDVGPGGILLKLISTQQQYSELALRQYYREAQAGRLRAELEGTDFDFDMTVPRGVDPADAQQAVEGERRVFAIRRDSRRSEEEDLAAQIAAFDSEIESLTSIIALYDDEMRLLAEDVAAAKTLVDRGLGTPIRLREVLRQQSATRRDELEIKASLTRAKQGKLDAERRRDEAQESMRTENGAQLLQSELEIAAARMQIDALKETLRALGAEHRQGQYGAEDQILGLAISRTDASGPVEIAAGEQTPLEPGDILRVTLAGRPPVATQ